MVSSHQDDVISTGAGNDIITAGQGNDSTNAGDGADTIDFGAGTDGYIHDNSNDSQTGAVVNGTTQLANADVITGAGNGDTLTFTSNGFSAAAGTAVTTTLHTVGAASSTTDALSIVRGDFNTSTQIFTASATGNDYLVQAEEAGDGTAASLLHSVVLVDIVGTVAYTAGATTGVITLAVA